MEGVIVNYRGSHKTQYPNQMIIKVDGVDSKEKAKELVKKEVIWETPAKKQMKGIILKEHGTKGAVRVKFTPGLPGQAIGTKVEVN
jgi:large subunit ribosomal protein L35Ae